MAALQDEGRESNEIEEYSMHVSQRYLDLTEEKLKLARLPRELPTSAVMADSAGISKAELDSLLDHWLESYDCRAQETHYNNRLPQYRTHIDHSYQSQPVGENMKPLRVHYVHSQSAHENAIPLLICHDWGSSFLETARVVEGLSRPVSTPPLGDINVQAFHVVCPSIPGFGFSDASPDWHFGTEDTAAVFHKLMKKLGYTRYMLHGSGWGYNICRAIALNHPTDCIALHTTDTMVPQPTLSRSPLTWLKYHIARLTSARTPLLNFGYIPSDFSRPKDVPTPTSWMLDHISTLSYALADSPTGLLAFMIHLLRPTPNPTTSSSTTPSLPLSPPWTPSDILTWTTMYWFPGPEAPLRWLRNASLEASRPNSLLWRSYSPVPLGISHFRRPAGQEQTDPPIWTSAFQKLVWLRRHGRSARWPLWEVPEEVVRDLREFAGDVVGSSRLC